jgi:general stress protein YciG
MKCPNCQTELADSLILAEAGAIRGRRGRGKSKARDPEKMRRAGKKGGWPKGRKRKALPGENV